MDKLFTDALDNESPKTFEDKLFEKTAEMGTFYVSNDVTDWTKDILTNFYEKFPFLQEVPARVKWKKKDPERGVAVGSLEVLGGAVPLVINHFEAAPLDVLMVSDMAVPMTEPILRQLFDNIDAFEGLKHTSGKATEKIFQDNIIDVPLDNKGSGIGSSSSSSTSRAAVKVASVLDHIHQVQEEDVISMLEACKNDSISFAKLAEHGNDSLLLKISEKIDREKLATVSGLEYNLSMDRSYKFKDTKGNWMLKQANADYGKTWTIRLTPQEAAEFDNFETNTIKTAQVEAPSKPTFQLENLSIGALGKFVDQSGETPLITIHSIHPNQTEKLASFKSFDGQSYLLNEKGEWNVVDTLIKEAAVSAEPLSVIENELSTKDIPTKGDFGSFVWEDHITSPAEVVQVTKNQSNTFDRAQVSTFDGFEKKAYRCTTFTTDGLKKEADTYIIPKQAKWVNLSSYNADLSLQQYKPGQVKLAAELVDSKQPVNVYIDKQAEAHRWLNDQELLVSANSNFGITSEHEKTAKLAHKAHIVVRDHAGLYTLTGPQFEKHASINGRELTSLSKDDAVWEAIHCGATEKDVKHLLKLGTDNSYQLEGYLSAPLPLKNAQEKVAAVFEETVGDNYNPLEYSKLIKTAAYFREKGSVDAILSLGLLRKGNVRQYLSGIDSYEMVLGELARLLVASRLGLAGLDSDSIKDAMMSLSDVLFMLKTLRTTVEGVK